VGKTNQGSDRNLAPVPEPPIPSDDPSPDSARLIDPKTGEPLPTADMREEFARWSRDAPSDPDAERAFVESKIEMIRTHPTLSETEKAAAVAEVLEKLRGGDQRP
jgi:hypothetical protein